VTHVLATALVLALDGESATGNSTAIAVVVAISLVVGYVGLAALWYFVFRPRRGARRERDGSD
jgi:hypothetical protein